METENTNVSVTIIPKTANLLLKIVRSNNVTSAILSSDMATRISENIRNVINGVKGKGTPKHPLRFTDTDESTVVGVYGLIGGDRVYINIGSLISTGKIKWIGDIPLELHEAERLALALVTTVLFRLQVRMVAT